ncbi:endoribonuclease YicC domain-containing protein [Thermodesulfobacteriota bacterium]
MASKINHAETAHLIVSMKNDLEKIREQVQNLE